MLQAEKLMLYDFASNLDQVIPVIYKYFSEISGGNEIYISSSPYQHQQLISSIEKNENSITIENFLQLLIESWKKEINYHEEIFQLKERVEEEFSSIYVNISNQEIVACVQEEQQKIIDLIYELSLIDKKQRSGEFCKGVMNGFEIDVLEKIEEYIIYILWVPFLTPICNGVIPLIQSTFNYKNEKVATEKIINDGTVINQYIKNQFESVFLQTKQFLSTQEIKEHFEHLVKERKTCSLVIDKINEFLPIINQYRAYINFIEVRLDSEEFMSVELNFTYDFLSITNFKKNMNFGNFIEKLPKRLKKIYICFDNFKNEDFEDFSKYLLKFTLLDDIQLDFSQYLLEKKNSNKTNHLARFEFDLFIKNIKKLGNLKSIILNLRQILPCTILNCNMCRNCKITSKIVELLIDLNEFFKGKFAIKIEEIFYKNEDATNDVINSIGNLLSKTQNLTEFIVDFKFLLFYIHNMLSLVVFFGNNKIMYSDASINNLGLATLTSFLSQIKNIKYLSLDFGWGGNSINDAGIEIFSKHLKEMTELTYLFLNFSGEYYEITDNGLNFISNSFKEIKGLINMILSISAGHNNITDKGMKFLQIGLKELDQLKALDLRFCSGMNEVTALGINYLSGALKTLRNITALSLNFRAGLNAINDNAMVSLALSLKHLPTSLKISMYWETDNSVRVSAIGEQIMRKARSYKSIDFRYGRLNKYQIYLTYVSKQLQMSTFLKIVT